MSIVVEDGVKLVVVDATKVLAKKSPTKRVVSSSNDKYYKLLEEQNSKLQEKVEKLEGETRSLRDQKEQMLIDERVKIEQIYRDKDEQLKNILSTFKSQFMLNSPTQEIEVEPIEAELEIKEDEESKPAKIISLKKYLKEKNYSQKKILKIKEKFKKIAKKDKRGIIVGKKYYLNLDNFDYRDILN